MTNRARRPRTLVAPHRWAAAVVWLACAAAPAAGAPALTGEAGLGGHARGGRWMPVTVVLDSAESSHGTLTAEWGGAVVRRDLDLAADTRRTVTVMLRTGDPRSRVDLTFVDDTGRTTTSLPVTIDADEDPVVACLEGEAGSACTVSLTAAQAPRDWRAWDVADEVRGRATPTLDPSQHEAIMRWAGRRQSEAHFGSPAPPGALTAAVPARRVTPWLLLALLLPAAPMLLRLRPRWRALTQLVAIAAAITGALAAGHIGAAATLRHLTVIHAFAGTDATIAETRLALVAARDERVRATLRSAGGWLEVTGPGHPPQHLDHDGLPFVEISSRLGGSTRLDAEYPGPPSPVRVTRDGDRVTIANTGTVPVHTCVFPATLDAAGITAVAPATSITLSGVVEPGDVMRCQWNAGDPPIGGVGMPSTTSPATLLVHLDTELP